MHHILCLLFNHRNYCQLKVGSRGGWGRGGLWGKVETIVLKQQYKINKSRPIIEERKYCQMFFQSALLIKIYTSISTAKVFSLLASVVIWYYASSIFDILVCIRR